MSKKSLNFNPISKLIGSIIFLFNSIKNLVVTTINNINQKILSTKLVRLINGTIVNLHQKFILNDYYRLFGYWLLDTIIYGLIAFITIILILKLGWLGFGLGFGLSRWIVFDIIQELKK